MKFLAFDLEIARIIPEGETDWRKFWPLGISCAATLTDDGDLRLWYGGQGAIAPTPRMNGLECAVLARYLWSMAEQGYRIVTWNGLGFDFKVLATESRLRDLCKELARQHCDLMFHFFCANGYAIGLDRAARGMGLPGKPEGMDGAMAPRLWAEGQHQTVLSYVEQDVRLTLGIADKALEIGELHWISRQGRLCSWLLPPAGWLTAEEALRLPEPDVSWIDDPWPRSRFTGWLSGEV